MKGETALTVRQIQANGKTLLTFLFESKYEMKEMLESIKRSANVSIKKEYQEEYTEFVEVLFGRANQIEEGYTTFLYEQEVPEFFSKLMILSVSDSMISDEMKTYIEELEKALSIQKEMLAKQSDYIDTLLKEQVVLKEERDRLFNQLTTLRLGIAPKNKLKM